MLHGSFIVDKFFTIISDHICSCFHFSELPDKKILFCFPQINFLYHELVEIQYRALEMV